MACFLKNCQQGHIIIELLFTISYLHRKNSGVITGGVGKKLFWSIPEVGINGMDGIHVLLGPILFLK